ncbi:PAS domain-containing protein [Ancylobacter vacuolatus]|uniref:histidine kinase n=1 Tax=Ancylobacter vacuolatus TaxID=223389 RepID=A0ABU0DFV0_9HYPH|nr:PAS domain-containing sensor histidine kinase [Ancylobacter vacuolatus]MDQ0347277.1 PAS domain S-box-containing protein [Ancylobacter vacuolatus]
MNTDDFGTSATQNLRAQAATALAGAAPAVLVRADGTPIAANEAGRAVLDEAALRTLAPRLAATLRPARPARLERLRLPGALTPATFACSLLAAGGARALLLVGLDAVPARPVAQAAPTATTPAPPAPARFTWSTGPDARLNRIDPRLAAALARAPEELAGLDWRALGALDAHRAVTEGASFTHLAVLVPTGRGDGLDIELGGAPIRGDGMRGFGLVKGRRPLEAGAEAPTLPPAMPPAMSPALPPRATISAPEGPPPEAPLPPVTPPQPPMADLTPPVRVTLSLVPSPANVVPLRAGSHEAGRDNVRSSWEGLSTGERNAFREIARALGARLEGVDDPAEPAPDSAPEPAQHPVPPAVDPASQMPATPAPAPPAPVAQDNADPTPAAADTGASEGAQEGERPAEATGLRRVLSEGERPVLDRLPLGLIAFRGDRLLYANRALLEWTGHADLAALEAAGGLPSLFDTGPTEAGEAAGEDVLLTIRGADGTPIRVEARLMASPWEGGPAMLYVLHRASAPDSADALNEARVTEARVTEARLAEERIAEARAADARVADERLRQAELALREAESSSRELRAILDTATDGVVLIDAAGTVLSMNHPAEALFGFNAGEVKGESFTLLLAPESHRAAVDYLDGLAANGVASVLNDGREVIGRVREGGLIPLFMTVGRVGDDPTKFCAVLRDITQWKRAEEELIEAKRLAERANLAKSDFLAKISHEIRTPLNAIIGFSEVMMEERFGQVENQRYRDYLRDIHASGEHLISLINDLLDLSKIEAGKLDLAFTSVSLNEVVQQCMGIMQPQANRERIIIRSSLASDLPPVVADTRSIRQIVLNLVSNSIKFTQPGGQVILSTTLTEEGEVVLRVRDTGVGMSESDVVLAMEPFRQITTSARAGSGGTGLGLPLTKALAEANRAAFNIRSAVDVGTIVEIIFPSTRVLAE